ncbi:hypothetical protein GF359_09210 [candidate division WOR-3 bacterium]|uniref:Uncharacterized protein n=1 Tax=candidate division WOR-3 bacterium TaxID=2052148 RepID=A0A9D5KAA7_UNCW3|nr:hypothetical protein [candidate division WOR-3 bacterium]MBD3365377.1 hypothetical protein [candidate division WOR-3 bacterium]
MRRLIFILPLMWGIACTGLDPDAAEEEITRLVEDEDHFVTEDISIDLAVTDSLAVDSARVVTRITLNTTFASESLGIEFNTEFRKDTIRIVGDTATVQLLREYSGTMVSTIEPSAGGSSKDITRDFGTERTQSAHYADEEGWGIVGCSFAEERSDTNITRIYCLVLDDSDTIRNSATISELDSFPVLSSGKAYSLLLRTTADTCDVVCFAKGADVVRFTPKENTEEDWTDRWEAEVTVGEEPLIIGVINRTSLGDESYPADFDLWIIPLIE